MIAVCNDSEVRLLTDFLYTCFQHDFRAYAPASLKRRLLAALSRTGSPDITHLVNRLLREPELVTSLVNLMTVQVSDLFRDPAYYAYLRCTVMPWLRTLPRVRVWVAGCSSGEEAYSFAILLHEEGLLERVQIYATDINTQALNQAQRGIYPIERLARFSENHQRSGGRGSLSDYYTAAYGKAVFERTLRQHIVFAEHCLATDSVFAEVDLVSCRNVLIYFNRELQDRAVGLFREALRPRGVLGIGAKESLQFSAHANAFEPLSRAERIFRKTDAH